TEEARARIKKEFIVNRQGKEFVLYAGLLDAAHQEGLDQLSVEVVALPSEANNWTAVMRATVHTTRGTFCDIGDANPANVGKMIVTHIIRMASTRAKARALRD